MSKLVTNPAINIKICYRSDQSSTVDIPHNKNARPGIQNANDIRGITMEHLNQTENARIALK